MSDRLDSRMVKLSLASSRERAKELIKYSFVTVNGKTASKPSEKVEDTDIIEVTGGQLQYVGRAGLKLRKAYEYFKIDFEDKICADIGASTGGFTDFMLQNGAKKVYAVDVGHGQLAKKLCDDERVVNLEGVNVKELGKDFFPDSIDIMTADLSFISLKVAMPPMLSSISVGTELVLLIKPQFEAGKSAIGKGGIVRNIKAHNAVLSDILSFMCEAGLRVSGITHSGIKGGDGNIEYITHATYIDAPQQAFIDIPKLTKSAFEELR